MRMVAWWLLCVVNPLPWRVGFAVRLGVVLPLAPGFPLGGVVFVVVGLLWIVVMDGSGLWFVVVPRCWLEIGRRISGLMGILVILSSFRSFSVSWRCRAKSDGCGAASWS